MPIGRLSLTASKLALVDILASNVSNGNTPLAEISATAIDCVVNSGVHLPAAVDPAQTRNTSVVRNASPSASRAGGTNAADG
jgi:hypothetical protein